MTHLHPRWWPPFVMLVILSQACGGRVVARRRYAPAAPCDRLPARYASTCGCNPVEVPFWNLLMSVEPDAHARVDALRCLRGSYATLQWLCVLSEADEECAPDFGARDSPSFCSVSDLAAEVVRDLDHEALVEWTRCYKTATDGVESVELY